MTARYANDHEAWEANDPEGAPTVSPFCCTVGCRRCAVEDDYCEACVDRAASTRRLFALRGPGVSAPSLSPPSNPNSMVVDSGRAHGLVKRLQTGFMLLFVACGLAVLFIDFFPGLFVTLQNAADGLRGAL